MDAFNHVGVAISIILGLGITHLLDDLSTMIQLRRRVRFYWVHSAWVFIVLVLHLEFWWSYWHFRSVEEWNFAVFFSYLLAPITLFVVADLMFPKLEYSGVVSLDNYFYLEKRWFLGGVAVYLILILFFNTFLRNQGPIISTVNAIRTAAIGIAILAATVESRIFHAILAALALGLLLLYLVMYTINPLMSPDS